MNEITALEVMTACNVDAQRAYDIVSFLTRAQLSDYHIDMIGRMIRVRTSANPIATIEPDRLLIFNPKQWAIFWRTVVMLDK